MHRCFTNASVCVSSPSTHFVGPCCVYIQVPRNPASCRRQAQAYLTHPHVVCIASCQQKGSLWDCQTGLLRECRQQYPQWLLSESPPRLTCWTSDKPCTKNRNMSPLFHFYSTGLEALKSPVCSRAAHSEQAGGCPGRVSLWETSVRGASMSLAQRGWWVQHLGLTPASTAKSMAEETGTRWISLHRGKHYALDWMANSACMCVTMLLSVGCSTGNRYGFKCCCRYLHSNGSLKGLY